MQEQRSLFRAFSELKGFDGWMIGKLYFFKKEDRAKLPSAVVIKQKKNVAVLEAAGEETGIRMTVVKPEKIPETGEQKQKLCIPAGCVMLDSRVFSGAEILAFAQEVRDDNWIHQTEKPIVPGFIMVEWLWNMEDISLTDRTMIFRSPAYAQEKITIYLEPSTKRYFAVAAKPGPGAEQEEFTLLWEIQ